MKTLDETKKGLECCNCSTCPYDEGCMTYDECLTAVCSDVLGHIRQLETENHQPLTKVQQLERERDALLEYLTDTHYVHCSICKHNTGEGAAGCKRIREVKGPCFEWRGVKEE